VKELWPHAPALAHLLSLILQAIPRAHFHYGHAGRQRSPQELLHPDEACRLVRRQLGDGKRQRAAAAKHRRQLWLVATASIDIPVPR
jgi:hypothetical protein